MGSISEVWCSGATKSRTTNQQTPAPYAGSAPADTPQRPEGSAVEAEGDAGRELGEGDLVQLVRRGVAALDHPAAGTVGTDLPVGVDPGRDRRERPVVAIGQDRHPRLEALLPRGRAV